MCAFIGFPLDVLVISIVVHFTRLHKPRNIVWLGVAFSNILILLNRCLQFCAFMLQDENLCRIFIFMIGLPYATLLLNLFLALIERYVNITYASWYRRKIRICYIVVGQITAVTLLIIVTKVPYIFRLADVNCLLSEIDSIELLVVIHFLIALCIIGQIIVYYKTKDVLLVAGDHVYPQSDITISVLRHPPNTKEGDVANHMSLSVLICL